MSAANTTPATYSKLPRSRHMPKKYGDNATSDQIDQSRIASVLRILGYAACFRVIVRAGDERPVPDRARMRTERIHHVLAAPRRRLAGVPLLALLILGGSHSRSSLAATIALSNLLVKQKRYSQDKVAEGAERKELPRRQAKQFLPFQGRCD